MDRHWLIVTCCICIIINCYAFLPKKLINYILEFNYESQDSLVVCRVRKNIEFRLNDSSNRASLNQGHLLTAHNSGNAVSEGDIDQMAVSEAGKAAECSKKCSSSNDSYSIEQFDSASESEQKLSNEVTLAESSSQQKASFSFIFLIYCFHILLSFVFYLSEYLLFNFLIYYVFYIIWISILKLPSRE